MPKKKLAGARTEAEEALWFEKNQGRILRLFQQAARDGVLRVGGKSIGITLSKGSESLLRPPSKKVMLRVPTDDLERARRIAERKGLRYQTYIKLLLRQGLDREEQALRRA